MNVRRHVTKLRLDLTTVGDYQFCLGFIFKPVEQARSHRTSNCFLASYK